MMLIATSIWDGTWLTDVTITKIKVQPNGKIYIEIDKTVPTTPSCPHYAQNAMELNADYPNFKEQFSLMLAGSMSGKKFKIYADTCGAIYVYAQNTHLVF